MSLSAKCPKTVLCLGILLAQCLLAPPARCADHAQWINQPLSFEFQALDGRSVSSEQYRGKVVLLDFWATWCGPCVREIPHVLAAHRKFNAAGFEIVGFSFDKDRAVLAGMVRNSGMPWPQHFDPRGQPALGVQLQIESIPSMWLLDKAGRVRFTDARFDLETKIMQLLNEDAGAGASGGYADHEVPAGRKSQAKADALASWNRATPAQLEQARQNGTGIRLKGIVNSARMQQAMLGVGGTSLTLEPGQSRKVQLDGRTVTLKCESIADQQVTLAVDGTPRKLTLE